MLNKKSRKPKVRETKFGMTDPSAKKFIETLQAFHSPEEIKKMSRYFREENGQENKFIGVRMKTIFDTAKIFIEMPLREIEKLLDSKFYEARMGAVSIMDFKARSKKIDDAGKEELFDLYLKKHDRINNWDMVDRCAPYVVGGYLYDKPKDALYRLARSKNVWERRTAIVSTYYFIRKNEADITFKIAEMLVQDKHDLIQKALGSWIREAGKKNKKSLIDFLNRFSDIMPAPMLRCAVEQLDKKQKAFYMKK